MGKLFFLLLSLFAIQALNASDSSQKETRQKYWYNENNIELLPLGKRGNSEANVKKQARFNAVPLTRPTPVGKFTTPARSARKGSIGKMSVPIELLEEAGVQRNASVRFGFPLAKGAIYDPACFRVLSPENHEIAAQFSITGFWPDDSIKWILVQFDAPLKANEKSVYNIEFGSEVKQAVRKGIDIDEIGSEIRIDTGRLTAVIDRKNFNLIKELYLDGKKAGSFDKGGIEMIHADGSEFRPAPVPDKFEIIERGAERVMFRVEGRYKNKTDDKYSMRYVARLSFERGRSSFRIEITHINTDIDWEFTDLNSLKLLFHPAAEINNATVDLQDGKTIEISKNGRIFQETDQFFTVNGAARNSGQLSGSANVKSPAGDFSVAVADCWKRWPKAFSVSGDNSFKIELLPEQPGPEFNHDLPHYLLFPFCEGKYRMKWGMSFTEKIIIDLAPATARATGAEANLPVIAVIPSSWYKKTAVFPGAGLEFSKYFDGKFMEAFDARMKESNVQREYGFFNYGDSYGERGINWTNNEYDMAHGLFMSFIRTGNRNIFRAAQAAARHTADVDTVHAYPDPYYIGANPNHKIGHTGGTKSGKISTWTSIYGWYVAATNGHTWVNGRIDSWQLAGDAAVMDSAYKCGDHIAFAMAPNFNEIPPSEMKGFPRECGWALRAACTLYNATYDPEYLKAADKLSQIALRERRPEHGGAWPGAQSIFIVSVLLNALCDYYQISGDKNVLEAIISGSKWALKGFDPGNGCAFYYACDWDGKPLKYSVSWLNSLIAPPLSRMAVLTDNPEIYEIARKAIWASLLRGFGHKGKELATSQAFVSEYLQSAADWQDKHPGTVNKFPDEPEMLKDIMKTQEPNWHMRGPETRKFIIRLKVSQTELELIRSKWGTASSKNGKPDYSVTLTEKNGREIKKMAFDPGKETETLKIPLSGAPGDEFAISIGDGNGSTWNIKASPDFLSSVPGCPGGLTFSRIGLQRFYFQVPANQKVMVQFSGTHPGPFGMWIFGEGGQLLFNEYRRKYDLSIENMDTNMISFEIKAATLPRICSIILTAASDGILKLKPSLPISGAPEFFSEK